jgi:phosphoglycerate dehydrogenase-like enzyme
MPKTLLMYDKALQRIGDRLRGEALDLTLATFDRSGTIDVAGRKLAATEFAPDYVWLSSDINLDKFQDGAFACVETLRSVGVLQTFNAGLDNPFYRRMSAKGVIICNSSAQAVAISEYVMGQVLAVMQPIAEQRALQARREWRITPYREISGTTWLIVGFGPIGREVARRAKAFGVRTLVVRRSPETSDIADEAGTLADLKAFAARADVVVLACPLNAETRNMADAGFFDALKPGALLVNIARGGLVDDTALIAALDKGQVATAVLDVFHKEPLPADDPLWSHPQVRVTSHTSFAGSGVRGRWDELFFTNIRRFAKGESLTNVVDPRDLA